MKFSTSTSFLTRFGKNLRNLISPTFKRFLFSLRFHLILLVLCAILPMMAMAIYNAVEHLDWHIDNSRQEALKLARMIADTHKQTIVNGRELITAFAQLPEARERDAASCNALFVRLVKQYPNYNSFALISPDGNTFCSTMPLTEPINLRDSDWFRRAMETRDFAVGDYQIEPISDKPIVVLAYPLLDDTGQVQTIVTAGLELSWLNHIVLEAKLPTGSTVTLRDRNGTILARHPDGEKWIGKSTQDNAVVKAALAQNEGVLQAFGVDGVKRLYAFTHLHDIPEANVIVSVGIPVEIAYSDTYRILQRDLGLLVLIALLAIAATWVIGDVFLVRRFDNLIAAAARLQNGDLTARSGITTTRGEVGDMIRAFDNMAEALEWHDQDRKQREEELRESEERYRAITQSASGAIVVADGEGRILLWNKSAERIFLYTEREAVGQPVSILIPEPYLTQHREVMRRMNVGGGLRLNNKIYEAVGSRKDGNQMPVQISLASWESDGNKYYSAIIHDITERKQAEEAVRHAAARAEALAHIAGRLNAQLDLAAVLNAVCEETARALNVPAASVGLYDEKRSVIYHGTNIGLPADYRASAKDMPRAVYDEYTARMGPLVVIPDMQALPNMPNAEMYIKLDIRTIASASMLRSGQLVGTLDIITFNKIRHFDPDELVLLQGLADQAAQAITNAQLYEESAQRLRHTQALREIDKAITASLDLNLILEIMLGQTMSQLGIDACDILQIHTGGTLEYAAGKGFRTTDIERSRLRLGEGYAGQSVVERRTVNIGNLSQASDSFLRAHLIAKENFVAYYCVPLIAKGEVKGVLEIFHRAPLTPSAEWLEFLEILAGQAAIAIDNITLFNNLQRSNAELGVAYESTLEGWSHALDLRDRATVGHTVRVTEMTVKLAQLAGLSDSELIQVRRGALLHDIGKMGIPDSILLKPGKLSDEEWDLMRKHPQYAFDLLSPIPYLRPALDIPYCHHEHWDGTGYPRGLKGEQIPYAARLFAVVDVWDAITSDRPYRAAWSREKSLEHIKSLAGTYLDPRVVDLFLKIVDQ